MEQRVLCGGCGLKTHHRECDEYQNRAMQLSTKSCFIMRVSHFPPFLIDMITSPILPSRIDPLYSYMTKEDFPIMQNVSSFSVRSHSGVHAVRAAFITS